MIDYHAQFVTALSTVLPTYYEMSLHSGIATPCISYMEANNYVHMNGDTKGYSKISYQVKIWGNDISVLQGYVVQVDAALHGLGFVRMSSGELFDHESTMIQKILLYEALALEDFNN